MKNMDLLHAYFQVGLDETNTGSIRGDEFEAICHKLNLTKGEKLLDIGCELVVYAAREHGAKVIGITVNKPLHMKFNQLIAASDLRGSVVKFMDYRNLVGVKFDKAVCLDPFAALGRKETLTLFGTMYNLLHPGGLFLGQCISTTLSSAPVSVKQPVRLVQYIGSIFHPSTRDGFLSFNAVERIVRQIGFEIQLVEDLSENYLPRLKHRLTYLQANQDSIVRDTSEASFHARNANLSILLDRIESDDIHLNQWLLSKPSNSHSQVSIPDSQRCCVPRNPD
jgi:cyclopropane-fatty-acyl-phospholipid synthase